MTDPESQQTVAGCPGDPTPHGAGDGFGIVSAPPVRIPDDPDEDRPVGGISVVPMPRREIARLRGTLRLGGLPRHRPTIVFDAARPPGDADDE